jgi:hypothetical protein
MSDNLIYISGLRPLDAEVIEHYLNVFLCDDAKDPGVNASIMVGPNFHPDSFSVRDRMSDNAFLAEEERDFDARLASLVTSKLEMLERAGDIKLVGIHEVADFCVSQVHQFLAFPLGNQAVTAVLLNQELPFVIDRVLAYCLFGSPSFEIYTHRAFNAFASRAVSNILQNRLWRKDICLKDLLLYSIASGLIRYRYETKLPTDDGFHPL